MMKLVKSKRKREGQKMQKFVILFISAFLLALTFQNCGTKFQDGSLEGAPLKNDVPNDFVGGYDDSILSEDVFPIASAGYHWKCVFELRGEKNYRWKAERLLTFDDNCQVATETVRQNNPKATILSTTKVFMGYHADDTSNPYHWKCAFTLRGERGYRWEVERYLKFDDDCVTAEAAVRENNPKASIVSVRDIFVGYHDDGSGTLNHWKCAFELRGDRGYRWEVERHLNFDDDCATAEAAVRANNPNARIVKVEDIFVGYH